ncbi:hypothetical protein NDU88_003259 [Pleurodeles waltl]|uniref:Uncharacterized protein n=1 Tax=Pleurodeles waltl TaxID=8319 RepID=A0AAV7MQ19_PLEWA|nr:hypothetical protein NDU88_003259 [Pleurodeles waltl]
MRGRHQSLARQPSSRGNQKLPQTSALFHNLASPPDHHHALGPPGPAPDSPPSQDEVTVLNSSAPSGPARCCWSLLRDPPGDSTLLPELREASLAQLHRSAGRKVPPGGCSAYSPGTVGPLLFNLLGDPGRSSPLSWSHINPRQSLSGHTISEVSGANAICCRLPRVPPPRLRTFAARLLPPTPSGTKTEPAPGIGLRASSLLCGVLPCRSSQSPRLRHSNKALAQTTSRAGHLLWGSRHLADLRVRPVGLNSILGGAWPGHERRWPPKSRALRRSGPKEAAGALRRLENHLNARRNPSTTAELSTRTLTTGRRDPAGQQRVPEEKMAYREGGVASLRPENRLS